MAALEPTLRDEMGALYGEHHQWLFSWLRKKLGCEHHAADVAQDTFVRILGSSQSLFGINEPRAYLTTTAKRLLTDSSPGRLPLPMAAASPTTSRKAAMPSGI
jgi:RNA polymerase sigma-70 factor (ECF subfamily)